VLRDGRPPRRGSLELVGHHAWPVPQPWLLPLVLLVVLVLDAEVVLGLLLARLDLAVVLPARLLAGHLRGLVQTLIRLLGVLARELLRLVHEFRHGFPLALVIGIWLPNVGGSMTGGNPGRVISGPILAVMTRSPD